MLEAVRLESYTDDVLGKIEIELRPRAKHIRVSVRKSELILLIPQKDMKENGLLFIKSKRVQLLKMKERTHQQEYLKDLSTEELKALILDAKKRLPIRLHTLASTYGFEYTKVGIRLTKSRWGSCSSKRNINLSAYLLLLPETLIDYVLIHELCHTRQMNHSALFWKEVSNIHPNWKVLRKELRNYRWNG